MPTNTLHLSKWLWWWQMSTNFANVDIIGNMFHFRYKSLLCVIDVVVEYAFISDTEVLKWVDLLERGRKIP